MRRARALLVAASLFAGTDAVAGEPTPFAAHAIVLAPAGTACSGGLAYDDGTSERRYGPSAGVQSAAFVMRFQLPAGTNRINAVCVRLARSDSGTDTSVTFKVELWAANGPGGAPGTLLGATQNVTATGLQTTSQFYRVDIPGGLPVSTGTVYLGPRWNPLVDAGIQIGADEDGPGGQPGFFTYTPGAAPNQPLGPGSSRPDYKALMLRAEVSGGGGGGCVPSATAMCLNQRFRVQATFQTPAGQSGSAQMVKLTDDTGYMWFFASSNVEAVVKVLDACALNSRYWVFAGGLTNVRTVITITDTVKGAVRTYTNPQSTPFQPVQDTSAFATCP